MKYLSYLIMLVFTMNACIETPNNFEKLPPGKWRGILKLEDSEAKNALTQNVGDIETDKKIVDYFELPFNFTVEYVSDDLMKITLINGEEKIEFYDIKYGRDPATAKDTVQIHFTEFDSYLDAFYEDNIIEGYWKVPYRGDNYQIPFIAYYGENHRFRPSQTLAQYDFSGQWKVVFSEGTDSAYPAIAEFNQSDELLTGTFMTETGDYRFLEGIVSGNKIKLSVFDGAHAFLFNGTVEDDTIFGEFRSGSHYKTNWIAVRDSEFKLTNAFSLSEPIEDQAIDFSFEDTEGRNINLNQEQYHNKVKLINIMGTWCPNCRDEILFLKKVKEQYPEVEIFSLAFEKYREKEKAVSVLKRYKQKMQFDWPLLYGGYADKKETTQLLGFVDQIYSYPTLLIVDAENKIVDIQTGFYGPATSEFNNFKNEFYTILESTLK